MSVAVHAPTTRPLRPRPAGQHTATRLTALGRPACPAGLGTQPRFQRANTAIFSGETSSSNNTGNGTRIGSDKAIRLAAQRVESLLAGTGDGETEVTDSFIRELPPENKTAGFLVASSILGSIATALCFSIDVNPWGGMDLSLDTAQALGIGALASLPIMRLRNMKWTESDADRLPALVTVREMVHKSEGYLLDGMAPLQVALICTSESLVRCIWEMSMIQDGLANLVTAYSDIIGVESPPLVGIIFPVVVASIARGISEAAQFAQEPEEVEVLQTALENCDRYYRVMNTDESSANEMASAFKAVTFLWFKQKKKAVRVAFFSAAIEVAYASVVWRLTGNLAAPVVVFALAKYVDSVGMKHKYMC